MPEQRIGDVMAEMERVVAAPDNAYCPIDYAAIPKPTLTKLLAVCRAAEAMVEHATIDVGTKDGTTPQCGALRCEDYEACPWHDLANALTALLPDTAADPQRRV